MWGPEGNIEAIIEASEDRRREPGELRGEYHRIFVDRDLADYTSHFHEQASGAPFHTFFSALYEKWSAGQEVAWLDAGCGTGRALFTGRARLLGSEEAANAYHPRLVTDGISDIDFSDECHLWRVRRAIREGTVGYTFGDICDWPFVQRYDAITCFEVLPHLESPDDVARGLLNLHRALKPSGELWATIRPRQLVDDDVQDAIQKLPGTPFVRLDTRDCGRARGILRLSG